MMLQLPSMLQILVCGNPNTQHYSVGFSICMMIKM